MDAIKAIMKKRIRGWLGRFWKILGPGVITGASDDDPSGIVTYAIAGAKGGFSLLWTAWLTTPLMAAVQEMCARIGIVTGKGLAGVMKRRYPRPLLWLVAILVVGANTINIGANIGGMAEATALLVPLPQIFLGFVFTILIVGLMIYLPYRKIAGSLKWLTFALFAYILAAFASRPDWLVVLSQTFTPKIQWNGETLVLLTAILGTTISPYLFFWQTSEEVEERTEKSRFRFQHHIVTRQELKQMREDVNLGMVFSNLVMFFIMVNAGTVFHSRGITELATAGQVASALEPLVGQFASIIFSLGIIGTGLISIPVLAGSAAYVAAETFGLSEGLGKRFQQARAFYGIIALATFVGFAMNFFGISPVRALFATAVIFGLIAPLLILLILDIANRREVMGGKINNWFQNLLGSAAFLIMFFSALATGAVFLVK
ncbi:divalent metal cation transporter [Patescibacteria group bacterium]|nr:MAG: divalent metal cation transporter [Patescibacteria group bacterium]